MKKILFVINPKAGRKSKEEVQILLKDKAAIYPFTYSLFETSGNNEDKIHLLRNINSFKPDIVASVGGDGTCNLVANVLADREEKMAIIPYGSANGMAAELNIPDKIEDALKLLLKGFSKKIDLININGLFCLHLADVGLNAQLIRRFEKENIRGLWSYARHLFRELFKIRKYSFDIQADEQILKKKAIMISFANASKYGIGAIINPIGKLNDGFFELCIIKPFPWYYFPVIIFKFFKGTLNESNYVEVISCKSAKIKCNKKLRLQFDGELISKTREISARIKPSALNIIVDEFEV